MEIVSARRLYLILAAILGFLAVASTGQSQKLVFAILAHGLFVGAVLEDDSASEASSE